MMNPEVKADWLARLRSGEYTQTKQALRNDHGYCCLGVLATTLGCTFEMGIPVHVEHGDMDRNGDLYLSDKALDIAGISNEAQVRLAGLNDSGSSFNAIADSIERTL